MDLTTLYERSVEHYLSFYNEPWLVRPAIPILYFGDIKQFHKSKLKIVTVGLNPSFAEFNGNRFAISDANTCRPADLENELCNYFKVNPYERWFNRSFELLLQAFDASYYGNSYGLWTTEAGAKPNHGMFTFWGEWEPQSKVTSLNSGSNGPRWLHEPQLNLESTKIEPPNGEWQNTDSLVFGDRFLYGVCRQFNPKSQRNTKMAKLENGDIVLFGSHIGGDFVLDTVFVVESHVPLVRGSEPSHCDSHSTKM